MPAGLNTRFVGHARQPLDNRAKHHVAAVAVLRLLAGGEEKRPAGHETVKVGIGTESCLGRRVELRAEEVGYADLMVEQLRDGRRPRVFVRVIGNQFSKSVRHCELAVSGQQRNRRLREHLSDRAEVEPRFCGVRHLGLTVREPVGVLDHR
jgi:hypothetical protein